MEGYFGEKWAFKQIADPASAQSAAIPGARVDMGGGDRLAFLVSMGSSTGATASFSFLQHTAATGGTSKPLAHSNPYYMSVAGGAAVKVQPSTAADTYDLSTAYAAADGMVSFEILSEDLDVNNGFRYVSLVVNTSVTAKNFAGVYLRGKNRSLPAYASAF